MRSPYGCTLFHAACATSIVIWMSISRTPRPPRKIDKDNLAKDRGSHLFPASIPRIRVDLAITKEIENSWLLKVGRARSDGENERNEDDAVTRGTSKSLFLGTT